LATVSLSQGSWTIQKIAEDSGTDKRFMNRPVVGAVGNKVFVTIGSGDRERPLKVNYPYASDIDNRFYVLVDRPYPWDENNDGTLQASESNINLRTSIDLDGSTMLNAATGLGAAESILDFNGWYLDLLDQGEQVVNQSAIGGGVVYFNSFQPVGNNDGLCANLGTAKAYGIPLFDPVDDTGAVFGQGIPIPPIIVTVDLDSGDPSCTGDGCGSGETPDEVVTVCIGCRGFEPVEITPQINGQLSEAFKVENVDRQ
jgi:type IV pilus assembly protein PilY1